jgi:hypothetical protein
VTGISLHARSRSAVAPRWVIAAAILLTVAIGLCAQALATATEPTQAVVWGSLSFAAYTACLLCLVGGGQGRSMGLGRWWFGPWSLLWYFACYGLATLTWVQPQTGTAAEIAVSSVVRALWLVTVGMTLWVLGYFIGPGQPARRIGNRVVAGLSLRFTPEVRSALAPWILYAIASAARIATAGTTGLFGYVGNVQSAVTTASSYQQWLSDLSLCGPLAVAAAALQVFREHVPGARVTLAILFLTEIAYGAASGQRLSFIITILAVAIPFTTAGRRLHSGLVAFTGLALTGLTFLLIIIPFNQTYRGVARSTSGTLSISAALAETPSILGQTIGSGNAVGVLSSSGSFLLTRLREIDNPAIIMQRTPNEVKFLSPVQLVEAPIVILVPRAVWPGKPILDTGYNFTQTYYELPASSYTSSAITPAGDLYQHGGWVPVIVGMFLLGCGVRLLDDVMDLRGNPHSIFLFLLLFPTLVKQENDWIGMLAGTPGVILVWFLAVYLTFRKREQPSPSQPPTGISQKVHAAPGSRVGTHSDQLLSAMLRLLIQTTEGHCLGLASSG